MALVALIGAAIMCDVQLSLYDLQQGSTARWAAKLAELDTITGGRYGALAAFREAQQEFQQYGDANCKSYATEMASGTGAGDVREVCFVDMMRARVTEMEKRLDPIRQLL